jgi:hypothetical protein
MFNTTIEFWTSKPMAVAESIKPEKKKTHVGCMQALDRILPSRI